MKGRIADSRLDRQKPGCRKPLANPFDCVAVHACCKVSMTQYEASLPMTQWLHVLGDDLNDHRQGFCGQVMCQGIQQAINLPSVPVYHSQCTHLYNSAK